MPLDKKIKALYCRTGNYVFFQLFHFKHRLPGSAARIIAQNFASCRLACSFMVNFFFISFTSFSVYWPGSKWAAATPKISRLLWAYNHEGYPTKPNRVVGKTDKIIQRPTPSIWLPQWGHLPSLIL
jgi:hypothetical protein